MSSRTVPADALICLGALTKIADRQRTRVFALARKEVTSPRSLIALDRAIKDYRNLVLKMQTMRFDLGLDEYRRGMTATPSGEANDTILRKQVLEAVASLEEIFERRGISEPELLESPTCREVTELSPHDRLVEIANLQEKRMLSLWEKEKASPKTLSELNRIIRDFGGILLDIQNMRFDLGLDEYRRGVPPYRPTQEETYRQVCGAYKVLEGIFRQPDPAVAVGVTGSDEATSAEKCAQVKLNA